MDNPVVKSAITSIVIYVIGLVAGKVGLTTDQIQGLSNWLVGGIFMGGGTIAALLVTWWKARQHTQAAQIQAVRNDLTNGVTPVSAAAAANAGIPAVSGPIK